MSIKHVLFDADGVVVNSGYFSLQYEKDFGVPAEKIVSFIKGEFQKCLVGKLDLREILPKYLQDRKRTGTVDELLDYRFRKGDSVDERVVENIKRLRDNGIKCYLATRQEQHRTNYMRKDMGFGALFDKLYSSGEVGSQKPEAAFFEYIQNDLGNVAMEEILLIDDAEENVAAARKLGMKAFYYTHYSPEYQKLLEEVLNKKPFS